MPAYARIASLAGLALAMIAVLTGAEPAPERTAAVPRVAASTAPPPAVTFRSARTFDAVAVPVRLRIPALRVDTALQLLGRQADGTVAVPKSPDVAGWYRYGPRPGQPGPAVILGHVDSRAGPGVFFNLYRLRPGTVVRIDRADGSRITFHVTKVSRVPKNRFPTDLVYGPTLEPTLRLVTCGGSFDAARRSYRDNVIAFAKSA